MIKQQNTILESQLAMATEDIISSKRFYISKIGSWNAEIDNKISYEGIECLKSKCIKRKEKINNLKPSLSMHILKKETMSKYVQTDKVDKEDVLIEMGSGSSSFSKKRKSMVVTNKEAFNEKNLSISNTKASANNLSKLKETNFKTSSFNNLHTNQHHNMAESIELGDNDSRNELKLKDKYKTIYNNKEFINERYYHPNTKEVKEKSRVIVSKSGKIEKKIERSLQSNSSASFYTGYRPRTNNADIRRLIRAANLREAPFKPH